MSRPKTNSVDWTKYWSIGPDCGLFGSDQRGRFEGLVYIGAKQTITAICNDNEGFIDAVCDFKTEDVSKQPVSVMSYGHCLHFPRNDECQQQKYIKA